MLEQIINVSELIVNVVFIFCFAYGVIVRNKKKGQGFGLRGRLGDRLRAMARRFCVKLCKNTSDMLID
jgi:hypothetical protein